MKTTLDAKMGAVVRYCGHDATFVADIFVHDGIAVIHAAAAPIEKALTRPADKPTHHVVDFPKAIFWKPSIGVFVVPVSQVTTCKAR